MKPPEKNLAGMHVFSIPHHMGNNHPLMEQTSRNDGPKVPKTKTKGKTAGIAVSGVKTPPKRAQKDSVPKTAGPEKATNVPTNSQPKTPGISKADSKGILQDPPSAVALHRLQINSARKVLSTPGIDDYGLY